MTSSVQVLQRMAEKLGLSPSDDTMALKNFASAAEGKMTSPIQPVLFSNINTSSSSSSNPFLPCDSYTNNNHPFFLLRDGKSCQNASWMKSHPPLNCHYFYCSKKSLYMSLSTTLGQGIHKMPSWVILGGMVMIALGSLIVGLVVGWYWGRRSRTFNSSSSSSTFSQRKKTMSFWRGSIQPLVILIASHLTSLLSIFFETKLSSIFQTASSHSDASSMDFLHTPPFKSSQNIPPSVSPSATTTISPTTTTTPHHMAVIMDGNRRYGMKKYQRAYQGHVDGAKKLVDFVQWCITHHISILTVYAFSTENWNRDPEELSALFSIVHSYCDEIQTQALKDQIRVHRISTCEEKIPSLVLQRFEQLVQETSSVKEPKLILNICFSYGSRGEIVHACRDIVQHVVHGNLRVDHITEETMSQYLKTNRVPDPDLILRTSGEMRLSNFLLWQSAYSEFFFVEKTWPEIEEEDFLSILNRYAKSRHRRFGK